jgi:hypothetical protein
MRITRLKLGVLLVSQVGQNDDIVLALFDELETELGRAGTLMVFADARVQKRMSPAVRDAAVKWGQKHRAQVGGSVILVSSKLMDMALSILAMLLGGGMMKVVSNEAEFERLIREKAPDFRGLPRLETQLETAKT